MGYASITLHRGGSVGVEDAFLGICGQPSLGLRHYLRFVMTVFFHTAWVIQRRMAKILHSILKIWFRLSPHLDLMD